MEEGDAFSFCPHSRSFVDEPDSGGSTARQRAVQVVYRKANVVNAGAALLQVATDRRLRMLGLQQLHERLPGREPRDSRSVGIVERRLGKAKDVPIKGENLSQVAHRDSNVGDTGAATRRFLHRYINLSEETHA